MRYNKTTIKVLSTLLLATCYLDASVAQGTANKNVAKVATVVQDESGNPITNAAIYGESGAKQTYTNSKGEFEITIPVASEVMIEADGFRTLVVDMVTDEPIVMEATEYLFGEKDVVDIPFGTRYKGELVNSVSSLNAEDVRKYDNVSSVWELVSGYLPGMIGDTNIRGIGDALVVVDGIPRDASTLNVEEIDKVTVLRDANAVALYGTQAINGVILITTKRGEAGKRVMNLSVEQGIDIVKYKPDYLSSSEYMQYYNQALINDGSEAKYSATEIANYASGANPYLYPNTDYYSSEYINTMRETTKAIAEFSGGKEKTRYYTQLGWQRDGSIFAQGEDEYTNRLNVRGNIDFAVNDFITSHVDAAIVFDIEHSRNEDYWSNAATLHPYYYSPLLPISALSSDISSETIELISNQYFLGGTTQYYDNVYGDMYMAGSNSTIERTMQFNGGVDVDLSMLTQGLSLSGDVSFDFYNSYVQGVYNDYAVYSPTWNEAGDSIIAITKINEDASTGVQELSSGSLIRRIGFYGTLDYDRVFDYDHKLEGQVLAYYNSVDYDKVLVTEKYAHLGFSLNYSYANRYLVNLNTNVTNSTKLSSNEQVGFSPTLGLGWVLSNEDFWTENSTVNYLKLKASAGIIKTDLGIDNNTYDETYSTGNEVLWGESTYSGYVTNINRAANANLTYEDMKNVTFGLEGLLFDKSLLLEANGFYNRYSGQVVSRSSYYPSFIGSMYPVENYEDDAYYGVELGASWFKQIGEVGVTIGANVMYADSKVMKEDELNAYDYQNKTGNSVYAVYGLESDGFYTADDIANGTVTSSFGTVTAGDIKYIDQNDDDVIDENDEVLIGNTQARMSYGINVKLQYKNFSLVAVGTATSGYNYFLEDDYFWVDGDDKYSEMVRNSWTEETAATATYPRLTTMESENNYRTSDFWMRDGSYFSLDRVQLTYTFPHEVMQKTFMKGADLYLKATDILYVSEDARLRQLNIGGEPIYYNVALGAKLMF